MKADYVKLRDRLVAGLRDIPGVECAKPTGAFYAYPNVGKFIGKPGVGTAGDVAKKLLHEAHVVVVPGEAFGTTEHIRLSYATSLKEVERGLERMQKFFGGL
jgi:aspartate aminotransferase